MAAGKSTVGCLLAERLGYRFVDLDEEVERAAGRSIPEIFAEGGERAFREWEARVTERADAAGPAVIAAGGGWMAREELRDRWGEAVRVWLRVEPEAVLDRVGDALAGRPMLDPDAPLRSIREMLASRREAYGRAELAVETTERSPREVAERIIGLLSEGSAAGTR